MVIIQDFVVVQLQLGDAGRLLIIKLRLLGQLPLNLSKTRALGAVDCITNLALEVLESPAQSRNAMFVTFLRRTCGKLCSKRYSKDIGNRDNTNKLKSETGHRSFLT